MNTETLKILIPEEVKVKLEAAIQPNHTPIWVYWEDFVIRYLRTGRSIGTVKNVRDAIKFILAHSNLVSIEDFNDPRKFEDTLYEIKQKRNFRNATLNAYVKNVKTYFIWMERQGLIELNKVNNIQKYAETHRELTSLSKEEVQRIVGHIMTRRQLPLERCRNLLFIDLLRFTAARPSELLQLTEENIKVNGDQMVLIINGIKQKGKPRHYALNGYVKHSYLNYIGHKNKTRPGETKLFLSMSKRSGWTHQGVNQLMKRLSKELKFRINCYGFRRSVATSLDEKGQSTDQIGAYLGHTRRSTTLRYIQESTKRTAQASSIMEKIY